MLGKDTISAIPSGLDKDLMPLPPGVSYKSLNSENGRNGCFRIAS